jgi:hypothetical protein
VIALTVADEIASVIRKDFANGFAVITHAARRIRTLSRMCALS